MPIISNLVAKNGVIASIGASVTVYTSTLDLGANYGAGVVFLSKRGTASAGEALSLEFSNDNTTWYTSINYQLNGPALNTTSNANMDVGGRIQGRYIRGKFVNGSTVQAATAALFLTSQPDDS